MFGTDNGHSTPQDAMTEDELNMEKLNLEKNYDVLWQYLSGTDSLVVRGQKTLGLGLPSGVLSKVYFKNTVNFMKLK